jgi:hypothetical protein
MATPLTALFCVLLLLSAVDAAPWPAVTRRVSARPLLLESTDRIPTSAQQVAPKKKKKRKKTTTAETALTAVSAVFPEPDSVRQLAPGITYLATYMPKQRWSIHVVRADLSRPNVAVRLGKGLDNIAGLERLFSMAHRMDSVATDARVKAGVNATFWKAGTNTPMGPTVADGVVLVGQRYKNWSSAAITVDKRIFINNFQFSASLRTTVGTIGIDEFNRRSDSASVVVYTRYFGATVPFLDTTGIRAASMDTVTDDSETSPDSTLAAVIDSLLLASSESGTLKAQIRWLRQPQANTIVGCRITKLDTGVVVIPPDGAVISFGKSRFPLFFSLFEGDTLTYETRLQPEVPAPVTTMAGGSPRLVRDGRVSVEWQEEGLRKARFVHGSYGRTCMGVSRDGDTLIILTVEPYSRAKRRKGMPLEDLARALIANGAWQGMNFDGGSSATMMIEGQTYCPLSGNRFSRKISTGLLLLDVDRPRSGTIRQGVGGGGKP